MDERTEARLIFQAVHGLKIDVPVMRAEVTPELVTLYLYGGQVKTWPISTSGNGDRSGVIAAPGGVVQVDSVGQQSPASPAGAGVPGEGFLEASPAPAARARGRAGSSASSKVVVSTTPAVSSIATVTPGGYRRAKKSDRIRKGKAP